MNKSNQIFKEIDLARNNATDMGEIAWRAAHAGEGEYHLLPRPGSAVLRAAADAADTAADALESANSRARADADAGHGNADDLRSLAHSADGARNFARRAASEARTAADRLDPNSAPDVEAFYRWREIDDEIQNDVVPDFDLP